MSHPFTVWNVAGVAHTYYAEDTRRAAEQHARLDDANNPKRCWPTTYRVRDESTGDIWAVCVDLVPMLVAINTREIPMPPATHVLWGDDVLCKDLRLQGAWPEGQHAIALPGVAEGAEEPSDHCAVCWSAARKLVADLRRMIGAPR